MTAEKAEPQRSAADRLSPESGGTPGSAGKFAASEVEGPAVDFAATDLRRRLLVPEPCNPAAYLSLKRTTPARLGIWRCGPRYLTETMLRFRADHAAARDAVLRGVSAAFLDDWGILQVGTRCRDKEEYLTRPDLGRQLDEDNAELLRRHCAAGTRVQILLVEGLSSTAVEVNGRDTYASLVQGLKGYGLETGTPVFVRFGRVGVMDTISEILQPEVSVALVGERPGLATAESLGCYISYRASRERPESARTVVSNIHRQGTPAVEAGAHIADLVRRILEQQASGLELKL